MTSWDIRVAASRAAITGARTDIQAMTAQTPSLDARITEAAHSTKSPEIAAALELLHRDHLEPVLSAAESIALNACDRTDDVIDYHVAGDEEMRQVAEDASATAANAQGF